VCIEGADRGKYAKYPSVDFEHFYGVSPRRYRELFERPARKKNNVKQPIIDLKFPFYMSLEGHVLESTKAYLPS
jgi:hypothetical protein